MKRVSKMICAVLFSLAFAFNYSCGGGDNYTKDAKDRYQNALTVGNSGYEGILHEVEGVVELWKTYWNWEATAQPMPSSMGEEPFLFVDGCDGTYMRWDAYEYEVEGSENYSIVIDVGGHCDHLDIETCNLKVAYTFSDGEYTIINRWANLHWFGDIPDQPLVYEYEVKIDINEDGTVDSGILHLTATDEETGQIEEFDAGNFSGNIDDGLVFEDSL